MKDVCFSKYFSKIYRLEVTIPVGWALNFNYSLHRFSLRYNFSGRMQCRTCTQTSRQLMNLENEFRVTTWNMAPKNFSDRKVSRCLILTHWPARSFPSIRMTPLRYVIGKTLERMCWRQFVAQWGDCNKLRIAPFNAIIIIIIIRNQSLSHPPFLPPLPPPPFPQMLIPALDNFRKGKIDRRHL